MDSYVPICVKHQLCTVLCARHQVSSPCLQGVSSLEGRESSMYLNSQKAKQTLESTTRMLRQSIMVFQRKKTLFPIEGSWNDCIFGEG